MINFHPAKNSTYLNFNLYIFQLVYISICIYFNLFKFQLVYISICIYSLNKLKYKDMRMNNDVYILLYFILGDWILFLLPGFPSLLFPPPGFPPHLFSAPGLPPPGFPPIPLSGPGLPPPGFLPPPFSGPSFQLPTFLLPPFHSANYQPTMEGAPTEGTKINLIMDQLFILTNSFI